MERTAGSHAVDHTSWSEVRGRRSLGSTSGTNQKTGTTYVAGHGGPAIIIIGLFFMSTKEQGEHKFHNLYVCVGEGIFVANRFL